MQWSLLLGGMSLSSTVSDPSVTLPARTDGASDLSALCLPEIAVPTDRAYTYSSAVSVLLLVTGMFGGFRKPLEFILDPAANDEPMPILIETPPQQTPQTEPEPTDTQQDAEASADAAPTVTIVAADPVAVSFAVPVTGNVLIGPARLATAPPLNNVALRVAESAPAPTLFTGAENRDDFPFPVYPMEARRKGMAGRMLLRVIVDANGFPKTVEVKESCGHGFLDAYAADWVKRRWNWQSGSVRHFEVPFTFALADK
jgi:TonB family protein